MSVQILDKSNTKSPNMILIDENYCLNDSFDIIQQNFKFLIESLNNLDGDNLYAQTVINRYNKNKIKYQQFLTLVSQFSANWTEAIRVYERNINIWNNIYTPLEVVYPLIIEITSWGDYVAGVVYENSTISHAIVETMSNWINSKYPVQLYDLHQKINLRVYFENAIQDNLDFNVSYVEECAPRGGGGTVCCKGCPINYPSKGCNRSIKDGKTQCANMYDWCPTVGSVTGFATAKGKTKATDQVKVAKSENSSSQCASGSCQGWGYGYDKKFWTGKLLELSGRLSGSDRHFLGYQTINFILDSTTKKWVRKI